MPATWGRGPLSRFTSPCSWRAARVPLARSGLVGATGAAGPLASRFLRAGTTLAACGVVRSLRRRCATRGRSAIWLSGAVLVAASLVRLAPLTGASRATLSLAGLVEPNGALNAGISAVAEMPIDGRGRGS